MERLEGNITVRAPVGRVYSYMEDPKLAPEWLPSLLSVSNIQGEGEGQTYDWVYKMAAFKLKGHSRVTVFERDSHLALKSAGGAESTWTYDFSGSDQTTNINLVVEYIVPIPVLGRLAEKLLLRSNAKELKQALANIKKQCERRAK